MSGYTATRRGGPTLVARSWSLAVFAVCLAAIGNIVALLDRSAVYGHETQMLTDAVVAQDLVTVLVPFPLILTFARAARAGSSTSHVAGLGCVAFLTYNYAIYCFSVTFGPLFLLWVGVLGLSTFALAMGAVAASRLELEQVVRPSRFAAWVLMAVSALFAVLWLAEIAGDLWAGSLSTSASDWNVPTNPVHVLDLAFLLPGAFLTGLRLRSGSRMARAVAPGLLVLFALTCLPIVVTPFVAGTLGHPVAWGAVGPVLLIAVVTLAALRSVMRRDFSPVKTGLSLLHRQGADDRQ